MKYLTQNHLNWTLWFCYYILEEKKGIYKYYFCNKHLLFIVCIAERDKERTSISAQFWEQKYVMFS